MKIRKTIIEKLNKRFTPSFLEVTDESHLHEGHAGHRPGGETHFHIKISAKDFANMNRVKIHREIYAILKEEMENRVHALAIKII